MKNQKGVFPIIVITLVALLVLGAVGFVVYLQYSAPKEQPEQTACTQEAKQCPDGSYVSRVAPTCQFAQCPEVQDETADWKTYTNTEYGFEFQYPNDWEITISNISEGAKNDFKMGLWLDGTPKGEKYYFEEGSEYPLIIIVYNKVFNPNSQEYSNATITINEITVNGLKFIELDQKGTTYPSTRSFVYKLSNNSFIKIIDNTKITDRKLLDTFNQILFTFKFISPDQTADWKTYINTANGFEFKYPESLGTKYASFSQVPKAIISQGEKINSNGCYISTAPQPAKDSFVTINNIQFCLAETSDVGAGQLYREYDYTTQKNGIYYTLSYVVHTSNGCGVVQGTPGYEPCVNFFNNYDSTIVKTIEESVSTFKFIQQ